MNSELYTKLFSKLDSLGAIRKDTSLGCEIITCECNDGCCGIEEGVIGEKYGICEGMKTSYIGTSFYVNIMEVKGHPPVLSDCVDGMLRAEHTDGKAFKDNVFKLNIDWDLSKPLLSDQGD